MLAVAEEEDVEILSKQQRAVAFHDPSKGKRRRRRRHGMWTRNHDNVELEREEPKLNNGDSKPACVYDICDFDKELAHINLRADPELVRKALMEHATSYQVLPVNTTSKFNHLGKSEAFIMELTHRIITPHAQYMQELARMSTNSNNEVLALRIRNEFKHGRYYQLRHKVATHAFSAKDVVYFARFVRMTPLIALAKVNFEVESVLPSKLSFLSKRTQPLPGTHIRGTAPLVCSKRQAQFITNHCRQYVYSIDHTVRDDRCWASTASVDNDFDQWYCEFDFGSMQQPTAILMQGRAPEVTMFPNAQHFTSREEYQRYQGLTWPVIVGDLAQVEYVQLFKVYVRQEKGKWIDLGTVFKANTDCLTQVRVNLPLKMPACRYLRIQPLSKSKGGFHGAFPAMRCTVIGRLGGVGRDVSTQQQLARHHKFAARGDVQELEEGYVRFVLNTPDESVRGYSPSKHHTFVHGAAEYALGCRSSKYDVYGGKDMRLRAYKQRYHSKLINESQVI